MVEREVRTVEDLLGYIYKIKDIKHIRIRKIEAECGKAQGYISRWKQFSPSLDNVLKVLSVLDAKMVLRTEELEDECTESESEKTEEVEARDMEHGETEMSELDMLILNTAEKALNNCNSLSEKDRLYRILQAFL